MSSPDGNDPPPPQPQSAPPDSLPAMNDSAKQSGGSDGGVQKCDKKSWFAIIVVRDSDSTVVEDLTIHLKIPDLGDTDRVTAKTVNPIKIDDLAPGGKGDVKSIEHDSEVWEATGDFD